MDIGNHKKLPHYSVVGEKNNFYLWVDNDGKGSSSKWIKGSDAFSLYNDLAKLFKKDKKAFVTLLTQQHSRHSK